MQEFRVMISASGLPASLQTGFVAPFSAPLSPFSHVKRVCRIAPVRSLSSRRTDFGVRRSCTACASSPSPATNDKRGEEEEALDELAMRAAEIHEVLRGLEDFKARIVDDATKLAKKVRASKKELQETLDQHPDIIKIDGHLKELREELEQIGDR